MKLINTLKGPLDMSDFNLTSLLTTDAKELMDSYTKCSTIVKDFLNQIDDGISSEVATNTDDIMNKQKNDAMLFIRRVQHPTFKDAVSNNLKSFDEKIQRKILSVFAPMLTYELGQCFQTLGLEGADKQTFEFGNGFNKHNYAHSSLPVEVCFNI